MQCPVCGLECKDEDIYCGQCTWELQKQWITEPSSEEKEAYEKRLATAKSNWEATLLPPPSPPPLSSPPTRPASSGIKPAYIVIGIIVIVLVLWGIFSGKKEEQKPAEALKAAELAAPVAPVAAPAAPVAATSAPAAPAPAPRESGIQIVSVQGGCYQMGDTFGDGYASEKPVHEVCVGDFYIGKYEVTQGQWKKVMGSNPSEYKTCGDNCPVENVSWDDIQKFLSKLNSQSGKNYRLPTEAEWEYAARSGGKKEKWAGTSNESSLGEYAWYDKNSGNKTHTVGQKKPNGLGIYDMTGNVWEWCSDRYGDKYYGESSRDNPKGPSSGSFRVFRGSSWHNVAAYARASNRYGNNPGLRLNYLGFRLVVPRGQ